jgi:hypothetical protein
MVGAPQEYAVRLVEEPTKSELLKYWRFDVHLRLAIIMSASVANGTSE